MTDGSPGDSMMLDLGEPVVDIGKHFFIWPLTNCSRPLVAYVGGRMAAPSTLCQNTYWQLQGAL